MSMSNKILVVLIALMVVLIVGMGGGLFMMWNKLSTLNVQAGTGGNAAAATLPDANGMIGPIYNLDTFIVNLADEEGNRYLRVTMDLELGNKMLSEELDVRLPQVRDTVLMILPTKRFEDIRTTEGKAALRDELLASLNGFLTQGKVINIYFKEFVIQ
jgi:flagellar FliL protein